MPRPSYPLPRILPLLFATGTLKTHILSVYISHTNISPRTRPKLLRTLSYHHHHRHHFHPHIGLVQHGLGSQNGWVRGARQRPGRSNAEPPPGGAHWYRYAILKAGLLPTSFDFCCCRPFTRRFFLLYISFFFFFFLRTRAPSSCWSSLVFILLLS